MPSSALRSGSDSVKPGMITLGGLRWVVCGACIPVAGRLEDKTGCPREFGIPDPILPTTMASVEVLLEVQVAEDGIGGEDFHDHVGRAADAPRGDSCGFSVDAE